MCAKVSSSQANSVVDGGRSFKVGGWAVGYPWPIPNARSMALPGGYRQPDRTEPHYLTQLELSGQRHKTASWLLQNGDS